MAEFKKSWWRNFAVPSIVIFMVMACNDIPCDDGYPVPDMDSPIVFGVGAVTKGLDPIDYLGQLDNKGFGVFAGFSKYGASFGRGSSPDNYISNLKINRDKVDTTLWRSATGTPTFWPITGSLSFFAYAPYFEKSDASLAFPAGADRDGMPKGVYSPSTDVTNQADFCLAAPQLDRVATDGRIPFDFKHTLTRIRFYFNLEGSENTMYQYRLTTLKITGVIGSNSFSYSDDPLHPCAWDEVSGSTPKNGFYQLDASDRELMSNDDLDVHGGMKFKPEVPSDDFHDDYEYNAQQNGRLYLLPQRITSQAAIEATITVYSQDKSSSWVPTSVLPPVEISLPTDTPWEAGMTVSYLVTLPIPDFRTASIKAYSEEWKDSGNEDEVLQTLD